MTYPEVETQKDGNSRFDGEFEQAGRQLQRMPKDMMLLKMENEQMMSVAARRPRDYDKIRDELYRIVDAFPEFASESIYNKPVGKVIEIHCQNCGKKYEVPTKIPKSGAPCPKCEKWDAKWPRQEKQRFARNLSIRAAETVRVAFGFTRLTSDVEKVEEGLYRLIATFVDYCGGNITQDVKLVSQFYKSRYGGMTRWADDRFFDVVLEAKKSICERNAILASVPGALKAAFKDYCEKAIVSQLTDKTVELIISNFASRNVAIEDLEKFIGRPQSMGWTVEDRVNLVGLWNSVKDGDISISVFEDGPEPPKTEKTGPVSGSDLQTAPVAAEELTDDVKRVGPKPKAAESIDSGKDVQIPTVDAKATSGPADDGTRITGTGTAEPSQGVVDGGTIADLPKLPSPSDGGSGSQSVAPATKTDRRGQKPETFDQFKERYENAKSLKMFNNLDKWSRELAKEDRITPDEYKELVRISKQRQNDLGFVDDDGQRQNDLGFVDDG